MKMWNLLYLYLIVAACSAASTIKKQDVSGASTTTLIPSTTTSIPSTSRPPVPNSNGTNCWPKENFALMQSSRGCPQSDWPVGTVTHTLKRNSTFPENNLINGTVNGAYVTLNFCAHRRELECAGAPEKFPPGSYCLYEYGHMPHTTTTQNCPAGFNWTWIAIDDVNVRNKNSHSGETPLGEFFSFSTVQYICCRDDGDPNEEIVLPMEREFILFPTMSRRVCQKVSGMVAEKAELFYDTADDDSASNGAPAAPDFPPPEYTVDVPKDYWGSGLRLSLCHYEKSTRNGMVPDDLPAPKCWPKDNFALFQPETGCPSGAAWTEGFVQEWEGSNSTLSSGHLRAHINGKAIAVGFCNHVAANQTNQNNCSEKNTAKFQPGSYCMLVGHIEPTALFDKSCPEDFAYSWIVIDDVNEGNKNDQNGTVPEGEYYDYATVYYTCCRDDGQVDTPISLPNKSPFVLMPTSTDHQCQSVKGMKVEYSDVFFDSEDKDSDVIPKPPDSLSGIAIDYVIENPKGKWGAGMHIKVCYYTPL